MMEGKQTENSHGPALWEALVTGEQNKYKFQLYLEPPTKGLNSCYKDLQKIKIFYKYFMKHQQINDLFTTSS